MNIFYCDGKNHFRHDWRLYLPTNLFSKYMKRYHMVGYRCIPCNHREVGHCTWQRPSAGWRSWHRPSPTSRRSRWSGRSAACWSRSGRDGIEVRLCGCLIEVWCQVGWPRDNSIDNWDSNPGQLRRKFHANLRIKNDVAQLRMSNRTWSQ